MIARAAVALAVALFVAIAPARALAWQEFHQTGDDVQVDVGPDGKATFRHALRWHVVRGPLKAIDVENVDPAAEIDGDVPIMSEGGRTFVGRAARVEGKERSFVRVVVDEPRALQRGTFTFTLRFHLDLVASRSLVRDGAMWRLSWSSPVASDGFDGARTLLVLPAAPDAPRPIVADTGAVDDSVVSSLRRDPTQDSLELVRPHVARGESVHFTVRVDARAFAQVLDPRLRTPPPPTLAAEPDRLQACALAAGLLALGLLYGWLVRRKARDSGKARAAAAGIAAAAAVGLQMQGKTTMGALCIAIAILAAAVRPKSATAPPRGPGRWLALRPEEAFERSPEAVGGGLLLVAFGAAAAAVAIFAPGIPEVRWDVALDAALLAPLFLGRREEPFLETTRRAAARWLARIYRKLVSPHLRVSPWARVPRDAPRFDELRLLVLPRVAMPGLLGLEVGLAWASTPVGAAPSPEVLARVLEESPAATRLSVELPSLRPLPGRRPEERVVRMLPRLPDQDCTVALVRELADVLTDRRVAISAGLWRDTERRAPHKSPTLEQSSGAGCRQEKDGEATIVVAGAAGDAAA